MTPTPAKQALEALRAIENYENGIMGYAIPVQCIETIRTALQQMGLFEVEKARTEHYRRENIALRAQIEIYKAANKDELQ